MQRSTRRLQATADSESIRVLREALQETGFKQRKAVDYLLATRRALVIPAMSLSSPVAARRVVMAHG